MGVSGFDLFLKAILTGKIRIYNLFSLMFMENTLSFSDTEVQIIFKLFLVYFVKV